MGSLGRLEWLQHWLDTLSPRNLTSDLLDYPHHFHKRGLENDSAKKIIVIIKHNLWSMFLFHRHCQFYPDLDLWTEEIK